jgi:CDP-diacylglycerol--glycerol-3-phosphate 3-phosphatidyltransferase
MADSKPVREHAQRTRAPRSESVKDPRAQGSAQGSGTPMTAANIVTIARIALIFVWVFLAELLPIPDATLSVPTILVAVLYILIAATDKVDGYLARSRNEITDFGKFLDPIADKLVVVFTLLVLMQWGFVNVWIPVIILTREFLVSALRMEVSAKGVVVAASNLGKWKTATTMVAIGGFLVAAGCPYGTFAQVVLIVSSVLMGAAIILTIWSGADYFLKCRKYI